MAEMTSHLCICCRAHECESGIVLDQFVVNKKNNEESACKAILDPLLVKGRIISADAIFSC